MTDDITSSNTIENIPIKKTNKPLNETESKNLRMMNEMEYY